MKYIVDLIDNVGRYLNQLSSNGSNSSIGYFELNRSYINFKKKPSSTLYEGEALKLITHIEKLILSINHSRDGYSNTDNQSEESFEKYLTESVLSLKNFTSLWFGGGYSDGYEPNDCMTRKVNIEGDELSILDCINQYNTKQIVIDAFEPYAPWLLEHSNQYVTVTGDNNLSEV